MVKHQRRSHQRGINPHEILDDCTSDSDSGESPSTPTHPGGRTLHQAASSAGFGHQMALYNVPQPYGNSTVSGSHEVPGQAVPRQHPGIQMPHQTSMPQTYYVTDQSNPGVVAPGMPSSMQSSLSRFSTSVWRSINTEQLLFPPAGTGGNIEQRVSQQPPQPQSQEPAAPPQSEQFQQPETWLWWSNVQSPVEVATTGQLPAYGFGVYDP